MGTIKTSHRPLTIDDLPSDEQWPRHELIEGSLVVSPYPGLGHQAAVARVSMALQQQSPDIVALPGANVSPDSGTLVIPDVVVITKARLDDGGLGVAPADVLLAVEVESPSTRRHDRTLKRSLYEEWGVPCLLVDLEHRTVTAVGLVPQHWQTAVRAAL